MKPTEQEIKEEAKLFRINEQDDGAYCGFIAGAQWAISLQPEWVQVESLLTVIGNGLNEHIKLLEKVNKGDEYNTVDMWDYQTVSESNEALVELRRLLAPELNDLPPIKD